MKTTGIVRRVDDLGRVVLPIEFRRTLDISERDEVEVFADGETILLKKYAPSCIFCGAGQEVILFRGKNLCKDCARAIAEMR